MGQSFSGEAYAKKCDQIRFIRNNAEVNYTSIKTPYLLTYECSMSF